MEAAARAAVDRLLFVRSSWIYPEVRRAADPRGQPADERSGADEGRLRHAKIEASCRCKSCADSTVRPSRCHVHRALPPRRQF